MNTNALDLQPSCSDDYDPHSLPVAEALRRIDAVAQPLAGEEHLALRSALGRVLAEDVAAPADVPAHTNSAMDGWAVRAADLPQDGVAELRVIGTALAGAPFAGSVAPGTAVRIMTGGMLPAGADTVVMQEHARADGNRVRIGPGHQPGQNVRRAGEDLARGEVVLHRGRRLLPADLGVLASLGRAEVRVRRRPRVAFFSTGDELRSLGEVLGEGEIYDSNRYTLYGMLA
nr:molybdopterin molybdotransferase MoeA [Pseudomonadota bacterium]